MVNTRDKFVAAGNVDLDLLPEHFGSAAAEDAVLPAELNAEEVDPAEGLVAPLDLLSNKQEAESLRAAATQRAALLYLAERRRGNDKASVRDCCDLVAREEAAAAGPSGRPALRPAETSVRRLLPRYMTAAEKEEKQEAEQRGDFRAASTRRAAEMYRAANGDGDGDVILSVTRCCAAALEECGVRPAETSVRRLLGRMYKEEGLTPKKRKARPPPRPPRARPAAPARRRAPPPVAPPPPPGGVVPGEQPLLRPPSIGGGAPGEEALVNPQRPAPAGAAAEEDPALGALHDPAQDDGLLLPPPLPDPEIDVVAV